MNSRERIIKAFNNEEVDRPPFGFWRHFVLGKRQFQGMEDPSILEEAYQEHLKYYNYLKPDMMKIMNEGFFGYPPIMNNPLSDGADLMKIKAIGPDHPWITEQVKHIKRISDEFIDDAVCFYNVFAPLQVIRIKFDFHDQDYERFPFLAENYPEELHHAGLEIQKDIDALIQALFDAKAIDGIYYCVQNVQSKSYDLTKYNKYIRPTEIVALENANKRSDLNILHICGYAHYENNLEFYKDYSAKTYNWAMHTEGVSLKDGKELFEGKCVLGGFDNNKGTVLTSGTKQELLSDLDQLLEENSYNGFVVGADCSLPEGFEDERILWIKERLNNEVK